MSVMSFTLHTHGSVVVIPLWLMRTLRPKEPTWFAHGCTIDGCSGNRKPRSGAPGVIPTNLPILSLAIHLSEPPNPSFPPCLWEAEPASSKHQDQVSRKSSESTFHWISPFFCYTDENHGSKWVLNPLVFLETQRGVQKDLRSHSKFVTDLLTTSLFHIWKQKSKRKDTNSECCYLRNSQRLNLRAVSF